MTAIKKSPTVPGGSTLPDDNELSVRLLDFLRDVHEREETPELCDVDDLYALISQYMD